MDEKLAYKTRALNLLPMNNEMIAYLKSIKVGAIEGKDIEEYYQDLDQFQYVRFFRGEPYYYTRKYVEETSLTDFDIKFWELITRAS